MELPSSVRSAIPLVIGLAIGVSGATLFLQSMPPPEGSAEEKVGKLEQELRKTKNQLTALEARDPRWQRRPGRTVKDGMRSIAEDLRDGKPVTPDDVFRATQPLIRDLAPLFDRIRVKELQMESDAMAGEMARKYSLNSSQQEMLKNWLDQKAVDESKRYFDIVSQDGVKMDDLAAAARDIRLDDGIEQFMGGILTGEKLANFKSERMLEKVGKVQQEADMKVERLNGMVNLDETQRGQVFGMMARGARDFDPTMSFEGLGTDSAPLTTGKSKHQAILGILRPDQREAYKAIREKKREEAQKQIEQIGLSLPPDWEPADEMGF